LLVDDPSLVRVCCRLTPTPATEDTLRAVFVLAERGGPVGTAALARDLRIPTSAAAGLIRRLEDDDLVERADHHTTLTAHGARHARHVVRRHRVLETFLVRVVGLDPAGAHAEADALEHAVSDRLLDRMDALLGSPARDPFGSAIPRGGDAFDGGWGTRLADAAVAAEFRVDRVQDREGDPPDLGIVPGLTLVVLERAPAGGPLWVRFEGRDHPVGEALTRRVFGREIGVAVPV
jgi:DtxR family transcriptional regulator, Mn-dependent transcriptional regulator